MVFLQGKFYILDVGKRSALWCSCVLSPSLLDELLVVTT